MKKLFLLLLIALSAVNINAKERASNYVIQLARSFAGDIFLQNGTAYLQPVVQMTNIASNSRFFSSAYVPSKVDKPYFRFGVQTMAGFVSNDMKTFEPKITTEAFDMNKASKYIDYTVVPFKITRLDTANLIYYLFKNVLDTGIKTGSITIPKSANTALGSKANTNINLPHDTLIKLMKMHPIFALLPANMQDTLLTVINQLPETFTIYGGADMNPVIVGIPQLEIGSIWGTEALIRFFPKINLGSTIGDFMFWGIGLKHSISQYFPKMDDNGYHIAAQVVYQGTKLTNSVGVTKADLTAKANIFNANLQFSKSVTDKFELYSGLSYDYTNITSDYKYYLPVELQWQLGLLEEYHNSPSTVTDSNGVTTVYTGDTAPQTTSMKVTDSHLKFILGGAYILGPVRISADFAISKTYVISAGIDYCF